MSFYPWFSSSFELIGRAVPTFALTVRNLLDSGSHQRFLGGATGNFAIVVTGRLRRISELLNVPVGLDAVNSVEVSDY
jgi:hypothetical protein